MFLFKYSFQYPLPKLKGKFDAEIFLTKLQLLDFLIKIVLHIGIDFQLSISVLQEKNYYLT